MTQADLPFSTNPGIAVSDLVVAGGEPRVTDLKLAKALGMLNVHDVRPLIKRHLEALERFGAVLSVGKKPGPQGGRPGTEYHLNKRQALYITAKSDTPIAADVTVQMVEVFDAYLAQRAKPVRVRQHRRALPAPKPSHSVDDAIRVAFSNLFDVVRAAEENRLRGHGSLGMTLTDALHEWLKNPGSAELKPDGVSAPFADGSDQLMDLYSAVMSANVRVEKGQEPNFGKALENVLGDRIGQRGGAAGSGKLLLDWNWKRTDAAKKRKHLKVIDCRQPDIIARSA